jgi:hypothetical protein
MATTVSAGPYRFFTRAELDTEQARYKAAMQRSGSDLAGAAANGASFQFGPRRDWSLQQWADHLAAAYAQLGDTRYGTPAPRRAAAGF